LGKPAPRDLVFFIWERVFPHAPRQAVESAVSCSQVKLLAEGERERGEGLYIVYSGAVRLGGIVFEQGDYFVLSGGGEAVAEKESILIVIDMECAAPLLTASPTESCRLGDLVYRKPVTASPSLATVDAVRVMHANAVSSVVVVDEAGRPIGIFTDTDLRRLVAEGRPLDRPVSEYMTPNPVTATLSTPCSDAVYTMMERNIKHLVVVDGDGRVRGVVTVRDIAYAEALGPLYVRRIVSTASTVEELSQAYAKLSLVLARFARSLHPLRAQANIYMLVRMASLSLRSILERAAWIASRRIRVGGDWAYIVLGSNARLEQPLPTDRDTMIVYRGAGESSARRLAEEVESILDRVGYPTCSHGYTARRLTMSLEEVRERVRGAAYEPAKDDNIVLLGLLYDAVTVYPRGSDLGREVRRIVAEAVAESGSQAYIRGALAAYRPKLGVLGRLPRTVDLKLQGLAPISFAAKALALAVGMWEPVSTVERLEALASQGHLPPDVAAEAVEAYKILLGFSSWSQAVRGSRVIDTSSLSGAERAMLRTALQAAARLVDRVRGV
jgi:CBS domain-containing protein